MSIWIETALLLFGAGLFWYLVFYRREKRLIDRLQKMVEETAQGKKERSEVSEEKFSALENSMKRCLDDSILLLEHQKQQKQVVEKLISDIAHQTLTPISNLKLYTELLEEMLRDKQDDRGQETLAIIQEQTEKLDFLIHSLVKLSRLESGTIEVQPKKQELAPLLQEVRSACLAKAEEKQIVLTVSETELSACYDRKWMAEALGNLVDNAVKYTEAGGKVNLSVQAYSFFVRIDVTDNGIGIPQEEINRIFTRFYRSPAVSEQPGVGIGLYLAREIIQAQKGYIKAASEPGKGSVFSVYLPE